MRVRQGWRQAAEKALRLDFVPWCARLPACDGSWTCTRTAPPLMARTVNMIGMAMAQGLESIGLEGATHMDPFDAWYPGYIDYLPMLQNIAAFWTETALYRYATPHFYTVNDFPQSARDLRPSILYSSPWKGGWWRLEDAVDYMCAASYYALDYAAKYKEDLLYNRYQAGRNTIRKYEEDPPYAYFIPQEQRDPVAPVELLRRLACDSGKFLSRSTRSDLHTPFFWFYTL